MKNIIRSIKKRYNWLTKVRFDKKSGFYFYVRYGKRVYVRHPRHFLPENDIRYLSETILFHYYTPTKNDQVVDLGVGYGDEAVYLKNISPDIKYLGTEAQPVIYECISNTFNELGENFNVSPFAITASPQLKFISQFSYAGVGKLPEGYIEIPTLTWSEFIERYNLKSIDLLKMNIEGAEKDVIASIDNFDIIKRFIISCHDFRANNGDGEFFRTKDYVTTRLKEAGYEIKTFNLGISWADDWIFAERK